MAASDYEVESQEALVHRNASRASGRRAGSAFASQTSQGTLSLSQSAKELSIHDENGVETDKNWKCTKKLCTKQKSVKHLVQKLITSNKEYQLKVLIKSLIYVSNW